MSFHSKCSSSLNGRIETRRAPSNESPWLFMQGICQKTDEEVIDVSNLVELSEKWVLCVPVRSLLIYLYEFKYKKYVEAIDIANECAEKVDTIRHKYWKYKSSELKKKLELLVKSL